MSEPAVAVAGLRKAYRRGVVALDGLDLVVEEGQMFGLLGPNGAGKTTLVKILLGLRRPTSGTATLLGRPAGEAAARRLVGYLPEDHKLPPYLTARQALRIYCMLQGESPRQRAGRIEGLLERVDLADRADEKIRSYSKGMKQRLGLAQALLHEPRVIFLDEPTDGVDPAGRKVIRDIIGEVHRDGATVFVNSHLLHEVERLCDRVAILDKGVLVESGTIDELTARAAQAAVEVRFGFAGLPPALDPPPEGVVVLKTEEDALVLGLDADARIDALIDRFRGDGVAIRSIVPEQRDLETHFLAVIASRRS